MSPIDLTGMRFGRLVAVELSHRDARNASFWRCRCDCGGAVTTHLGRLRLGKTKSCGCLRREMCATRGSVPSHGHAAREATTSTYQSWVAMRARCGNPQNKSFKDYGGRGIAVCERWRESFEAFLADMGERPQGMSIDRKDQAGNYATGNCRWADARTQAANRRPRAQSKRSA
jgi:hypothetical protein